MNVHVINPLVDTRWGELIDRHPLASPFHRREWLAALQGAYGYEPLAITSAAPGELLRNGIVACRVSNWVQGTHLVSLPFSDHCQPLVADPNECCEFVRHLQLTFGPPRYKYLELRPLVADPCYGQPGESFWWHELTLDRSLEAIFRGFHKDSIQRSIRRAEREQLEYETGRSDALLQDFYRLVLLTRRRHGILPQPRSWFEKLQTCMGESLQLRVARKAGRAIAAMLTLRHRSTVVYKYGCSDEGFHSLGGMPFLFWKLVEESKSTAAEAIDFGRSDLDNPGLVAFKDKFGTTKKLVSYYRHPSCRAVRPSPWMRRSMRPLMAVLPDIALTTASRLVYKYMS